MIWVLRLQEGEEMGAKIVRASSYVLIGALVLLQPAVGRSDAVTCDFVRKGTRGGNASEKLMVQGMLAFWAAGMTVGVAFAASIVEPTVAAVRRDPAAPEECDDVLRRSATAVRRFSFEPLDPTEFANRMITVCEQPGNESKSLASVGFEVIHNLKFDLLRPKP